jgi:hypothetical protein
LGHEQDFGQLSDGISKAKVFDPRIGLQRLPHPFGFNEGGQSLEELIRWTRYAGLAAG